MSTTPSITLYEPRITFHPRLAPVRKLTDATLLAPRFRELFAQLNPDPNKEAAIIITLSSRFQEVGYRLLTLGTSTRTLICPADTLRAALLLGGTAFAIAHNHPSGDPEPSGQDHRLTHRLREAAKCIDLIFSDHIIIGEPNADPIGVGHYSFRQAGII